MTNGEQIWDELYLGLEQTIEGWSRSLEMGGIEPEGHAFRVAEMSLHLALKCGIPHDELPALVRGALLHDVGKVVIPEEIRNKPGKLDPAERAIMEQHPIAGRQLLLPIEILRPAIAIPFCHHERWDGRGYPRGLAGEDIPLAARVFAVADVWDALTTDQVYRPAWSVEATLEHIEASAGTHFDPSVVNHFLVMASDKEKLTSIMTSENRRNLATYVEA